MFGVPELPKIYAAEGLNLYIYIYNIERGRERGRERERGQIQHPPG